MDPIRKIPNKFTKKSGMVIKSLIDNIFVERLDFSQINGGDFAKFCGLLRIYEL